MEKELSLSEKLKNKLETICKDSELVKGILLCLENDEERQLLLDFAETGGEEVTPKNLAYIAINIDDERNK